MSSFDEWYNQINSDWKRVSLDLGKEEQLKPDNTREELIHRARLVRLQAEYKDVDLKCQVASMIRLLKESTPVGEVHVSLPEISFDYILTWPDDNVPF